MARHREVRRHRLIRNITIFCGCLVVAVMFIERGLMSETPTIVKNNNNNNNNNNNDNNNNNNIVINPQHPNTNGISYNDKNNQINNNDQMYQDNGNTHKSNNDDGGEENNPFQTHDTDNNKNNNYNNDVDDENDDIYGHSEDDDDNNNINNNNNDNSEDKDDVGDDYDQQIIHESEEIEDDNDINDDEDNTNNINNNNEDEDEQEESSSLSSSETISPISSSLSSSDTVSPSSSSSLSSSEIKEDESSGYIDSSEDDEFIDITKNNNNNVSLSTSTLSPEQIAKAEKKEKENKEKETLEKKVKEEYYAEITGVKNGTIVRNSTDLRLSKPLLFLHIPKTAGSTLTSVFKNNEKADKYKHFWNHPRLDDLPVVPTMDTIFGHFRYGLHFYFDNKTASYATFLREPIQRVISYYHFHLQDTQDPAHKFAMNRTFEEWLDESQAAQNEMTKCLSGIRSEFYPSQESFEMAKHHLKYKMGFVGLTEKFKESLHLMKHYLGFTNLKFDNTKVGIKKPKEVSPEIIEKIRQKNLMDIEIYEMGKKIFEQQMEEVGRYLLQKDMDRD